LGETNLSAAATDLLLVTARSELTPDFVARVRHALAGIDDWTALIQAALDHGTAGLLCRHMLSAGTDLLPDDMVSAANAYIASQHQQYLRATRDLAVVLDALHADGIAALPYKGPVLAAYCHAEPELRGCRDLDVLIREPDIAATMVALGRLGYCSLQTGLSERRMRSFYAYNGQDALVCDDRMLVEPHWRLNPTTLHAEIGTAGLFDRASSVELHGRATAAPSREDMLLICCMHGCKEQWSRLIWLADVAALLRHELDWPAILARADATGTRRMLLIGIALARDLLGVSPPELAARALDGDATARRLASSVAADLFASGGETPSVYRLSRFRFHMRERRSDRLRYTIATLLTARAQHFRFVDLPQWLTFLYPVVRLGHDFVALPIWRIAHGRHSAPRTPRAQ
jgi:hypothetical protein